jgi:DNA-binding NtrC family response regulator
VTKLEIHRREEVRRAEREKIEEVLAANDGELKPTAEALDIAYSTLLQKMREHGLTDYGRRLRAMALLRGKGGQDGT